MDVYAQLCEEQTLLEAWGKVRKKNARGGIDGVTPEDLDDRIDRVVRDLSRDLSRETYIPAPLDRLNIPKFNKANEWRPLSLPVVADKIVQQALVNLISPEFEKEFLDCSYAYRPRKGPVRAIKRVEHILSTRKAKWAVTLDIDNFFDTLNHDLLLDVLWKKINDSQLIRLIRLWLKAGYISGKGDYMEPDKGIAQGAVISPLLSNVYLHRLDTFAVNKSYPYVRYSDNLIILFSKRDPAYVCYESLRAFLGEELSLRLNRNQNPVKHINHGFTFLGIYFKKDERRMSRQKETKTFKKLNWMTDRTAATEPDKTLERFNESIRAKKRFYAFIRPERQFAAFDQHLGKRLPGLLAIFTKTRKLNSKKDITDFLNKLIFFSDMPRATHQALVRKIADETCSMIDNKGEIPKKETAEKKASSTAKRSSARKNRFLRQRSCESEVIVATPGVFIGKTGRRLVLKKNRKNIHEQPFSKIRQISVTSSGVALSSDVIWSCSNSRVPLAFLNRQGKIYALLQTPSHSAGDLSVFQIRLHESEKALALSRKILSGKSRNQMNVIKFYSRHRLKTDPVFTDHVSLALERMGKDVKHLRDIEFNDDYQASRNRLFTTEARISSHYWGIVKILLPAELGFVKRQKKGATDVVNSMLNYGYGILYQRIWHGVTTAGLNPNISFLHALQKNKPTLIYDMIEEFRQALVDRPLFSTMTRGSRYRKFTVDPDSGLLDNYTRETVLKTVLERLATLIGFRGRKMRAEDIIQQQARQLADYVRGRKNTYKPFIINY